jgi:hypothetical protein
LIRLSAIIATAIPIAAAAQQTQITDAELRSAYCFAVLAHSVADLRQVLRFTEDRLVKAPNAEDWAKRDPILSEFRRTLNHELTNYDRVNAHLLASNTLRKGGAFSQATARGDADYAQCRDELSHHNCTGPKPPWLESYSGQGKGAALHLGLAG